MNWSPQQEDAIHEAKKCRGCARHLKLSDFPPDKRAPDGKQARCRKCINEWMKVHYRTRPAWSMWRRAAARAKQKGWEFTITVSDLEPLPTHCPVFGTPLRLSAGPQDPDAYSLDRIDNSRGYTPDNVVVMSYRANRLKNDGTAADHEAIARWMRRSGDVS